MNGQKTIWVVDDDHSIRWVLEKALGKSGFISKGFEGPHQLLDGLQAEEPDVIISDIRMPGMDGLTLLKQIHEIHPDLPVIIITAHSDLDSAVNAYDVGAFEYLPKPFDLTQVTDLVQRALDSRVQKASISGYPLETDTVLIGQAPSMQEVFRAIGRLSRSNISVLITGESGTGKELVAKALHEHSPRSAEPFVALNMAAIPRELMESELFGHEKGAFTGAQARRIGRFEQARGGTLFLDEIGDMPLDAQTRLLRVLSDGRFYRVGGSSWISADVRIIAATHQNLEQLVNEGSFREDLFHRLNVIRIRIPPLRERREDIPALMNFFLQRAASEQGETLKKLNPEALAQIEAFDWPGNVRQLENVARWLTVMASGQEIYPRDLPQELQEQATTEAGEYGDANWKVALEKWVASEQQAGAKNLLSEVESVMIQAALNATNGHKQAAARLLGWGRNTLARKLKDNS